MAANKLQHVIITINHPTDTDYAAVGALCLNSSSHAYQTERGADGVVHIQGYFRLSNRTKFTTLKNKLPRAHIEVAINPIKAFEYCSKEDTRIEGPSSTSEPPESPQANLKGSRFHQFQDFVKTHDWDCSVDAFPDLLKNEGALRKIYERANVKTNALIENKRVVCIWGPPGVGKTMYVMKQLDGKDFYRQTMSTWFDNYNYSKRLFIDDMEPERFPRNLLLQLLDTRVTQVQVKGGACQVNFDEIWITSNFDPSEWYPKKEKGLLYPGQAVRRRMDVYKMGPGFVLDDNKTEPLIGEMDGGKGSGVWGHTVGNTILQ